MGKKKTNKPTGLSIKRNGNNFICTWNRGEKYDSQKFEYNVGGKSWPDGKVKKDTTKFTFVWNAAVSLSMFKCRVSGTNNKKKSETVSKQFDIKPPKNPTAAVVYNNDVQDPRVTFAWSVENKSDSAEWFYRVAWHTRLVDNNDSKKTTSWSSWVYSTSASSSYVQSENSTVIYAPNASHKREFEIIAYGPGGQSTKITKSYTYAKPPKPEIAENNGCILTPTGTGGYLCELEWNSNESSKYPIDSMDVQYLIATPRVISTYNYNRATDVNANNYASKKSTLYTRIGDDDAYAVYTLVDQNSTFNKSTAYYYRSAEEEETEVVVPTGSLSWKTVGTFFPKQGNYTSTFQTTVAQTKKKKKVYKKRLKKTTLKTKKGSKVTATVPRDASSVNAFDFVIDQFLEENQVIFVRIVSKHGPENQDTASEPYLCDDNFGLYSLSAPTNVTITPPSNDRITVTARNNCSISNSFLIISCEETVDNVSTVTDIGYILPEDNGSKTVNLPAGVTNYSIGVRTAIGKPNEPIQDSTRSYEYYVNSDETNIHIESETSWIKGSTMPAPPSFIELSHVELGTIHVKWDWDWKEADSAELSWSNYKNAWESTSEPSYYSITNLYNGEWNITNLELGSTYYVRIRLKKRFGESELVSRWSDLTDQSTIFLSAAPAIPSLEISPSFINPGGSFTAIWTYISTDNTLQQSATLAIVEDDDTKTTIDNVGTEQTLFVDTKKYEATKNWEAGTTVNLAAMVVSESSSSSKWSETVPLEIVAPATCSIESATFTSSTETEEAVTPDSDEPVEVEVTFDNVLTHLPLEILVTGAGEQGTTTITIERFDSFVQPGPDDNEFKGYKGEIIYAASYTGESVFRIVKDDPRFFGSLDEGAPYTLRATIKDEHNQTDFDYVNFLVNWDHDATMPEAELEYITDNEGNTAAKINILGDTGYSEGDVIDIYRLSADKPTLIYSGGAFRKSNNEFQSYIDPYPTIGIFGGYRIVYRTFNNDYIDSDGNLAFLDLDYEADIPIYKVEYNIINFGGEELNLMYNVDLSSSWDKDFTETKYLGGSVQGDWNPAVSRTGSISATVITSDLDTIKGLRRLAVYTGICHIRTLDGSNYNANIDVSEDLGYQQYYDTTGAMVKILSYTLNITRVDSIGMEGMTLEDWEEL